LKRTKSGGRTTVAVVGASGYIGGELLRLLLGHPEVDLIQATSDTYAGRPLYSVHPNLRHLTSMTFTPHADVGESDVLFLSLPHGETMQRFPDLASRARVVIDLSADFRLRDRAAHTRFYGDGHPCHELSERFVPGLPELYRERLRGATWISVPGCMAVAAILAVHPLAAEGVVAGDVLIDAHTGSSGSGQKPTPAGQHAERSGVMRVYEPLEHRHQAEVEQACGVGVCMTVTAVEAVRGVQVLAHVRLARPLVERDVWALYRGRYGQEPFVRLVSQRRGIHRFPEPKILSGTNFCDVGFAADDDGCRLVLMSALDNLVKGGAGSAVQSLNVALGFEETAGLEFAGLHPV
jgi:N-acetyl-gamma-glutamyl-phosphate/LysW-gamma-L-alpha-aminoadipyl-6-phosphate reductase